MIEIIATKFWPIPFSHHTIICFVQKQASTFLKTNTISTQDYLKPRALISQRTKTLTSCVCLFIFVPLWSRKAVIGFYICLHLEESQKEEQKACVVSPIANWSFTQLISPFLFPFQFSSLFSLPPPPFFCFLFFTFDFMWKAAAWQLTLNLLLENKKKGMKKWLSLSPFLPLFFISVLSELHKKEDFLLTSCKAELSCFVCRKSLGTRPMSEGTLPNKILVTKHGAVCQLLHVISIINICKPVAKCAPTACTWLHGRGRIKTRGVWFQL